MKSKPPQKVIDGPARELFTDGQLSAAGRMAGGKKSGVWKYHYRSGGLKAKGRFAAGLMEGLWKW